MRHGSVLTLKTNYKTWLHRVCISHSHIFSASLYDAALLSFWLSFISMTLVTNLFYTYKY